jgi:hypothetical protein
MFWLSRAHETLDLVTDAVVDPVRRTRNTLLPCMSILNRTFCWKLFEASAGAVSAAS